jgi:hypothetical protein
MISNIQGEYGNPIVMEIVKPKIIDVSLADYEAETFTLNGTKKAIQHPFVVCAKEEVTLKVLPFYGTEPLTWTFTQGPYPMPLKKIFADAGNSASEIQIGY